jgi:hypothetical protein
MQVGGEDVGRIEALAGKVSPVRLLQDLGVDLALPKYGEVLALGVVFQAGKIDESLFPTWFTSGFDGFNQISPGTHFHHRPWFQARGCNPYLSAQLLLDPVFPKELSIIVHSENEPLSRHLKGIRARPIGARLVCSAENPPEVHKKRGSRQDP